MSSFPHLSVVRLLWVKELPVTTVRMHWQQYHTNQDSLVPSHKLIQQLESQGVISKTHSPLNSPTLPVQKFNRVEANSGLSGPE